ncbi:MAG TPA: VOC family protein [Blastocatellia bacterium]|nr:VOC family protein [Blastocatellia bacterium]
MKITRLNHVQISVPIGSEDEVRRFYCDALGLKEIPKPEPLINRGGLWLEIGDLQIHFGTENIDDRAASKRHVAFEVTNLHQARATLEQNGIKIKDSIPIAGYDRFEIRDPFGNRLEFMQRH